MSEDQDKRPSWSQRLFGGFRKTSERLSENLAGITENLAAIPENITAIVAKTKLDPDQLDDIEDALIQSDLGPRTAARVRERLEGERFERGADDAAIRKVVAEEIAEILRPVAKPLEITAFPRPQVVLVIGVNGSGKTTTIAKLAHLFQEQDYGVMLAAGDTFRAAAIGQLGGLGRSGRGAAGQGTRGRRSGKHRVRRGQARHRYRYRRAHRRYSRKAPEQARADG